MTGAGICRGYGVWTSLSRKERGHENYTCTVWGAAGYRGVGKREENEDRDLDWETAMKPRKRRQLDKSGPEEAARRKAAVRAKVVHPFLYLKGA